MYFDDVVAENLEEQEQQAPVKPRDWAAESKTALEALDVTRTGQLRTAQIQAAKTTPERAAEVRRLAVLTGLSDQTVERRFDELSAKVTIDNKPYAQIMKESPALTAWASEPSNAAIAKDDMEQLGLLEWIVNAPGKAFAQGKARIGVADIRAKQLWNGTLTREDLDRLNADKYYAEHGGALGAGDSWFAGAVTEGSRQFANALMGAYRAGPVAAVGGAVGATIGGILGSFAGGVGAVPGAVGGAKTGVVWGARAGAFKFGAELEAGLAFDEFLDFKDETGKTIDPQVARGAAIAAGVLNGGLEVVGLETLAKTIPGVKKLTGALARDAIKTALRNPTTRAAIADVMKGYVGTLTTETLVEMGQRLTTVLAGDYAKIATDPTMTRLTPGEMLTDVLDEGAGAIQGFALMPIGGGTWQVARDLQRVKQADQAAAFFQALSEGASQSQTIKRMPEAAQQFLERATQDGPVPNIYVPVQAFREYFQSLELDPARVAEELTGRPDALEEALKTGEDLKIPTAAYAVKLAGTEHHSKLALELRLDPEGMNGREAAAYQEELKARTDAIAAAKAAGAETPQAQVRAAALAEMKKAGMPDATAERYATLYEAAFSVMALKAKVDPLELYQRYGLKIVSSVAPAAKTKTAAPAASAQPGATIGASDKAPEAGTTEGLKTAATASALDPVQVSAELPDNQAAGREGGDPAAPAAPPTVQQGAGRMAGLSLDELEAMLDSNNPENVANASAEIKVRAAAMAARKAARARLASPGGTGLTESVLDPEDQTTENGDGDATSTATGDLVQDPLEEPVAAPGQGDVAPGSDGPGPQVRGTADVPAPYRQHFDEILAAANELGYSGSPDSLASLYLDLLDGAIGLTEELETIGDDNSWRGLLVAISEAGGISIDAEDAMKGEIQTYMDSLAKSDGIIKKSGRNRFKRQGQRMPLNSAGIQGAPGIFKRSGGVSFDTMREHLSQDPRWAHYDREGINALLADLDIAVSRGAMENRGQDVTKDRARFDVIGTLEGAYGVRTDQPWWNGYQIQGEADLLTEEGITELEAGADAIADDTSFNVEEFGPDVDVLSTGELQPRLPGDVGDVRGQEIATPAEEAPFALGAEVGEGEQADQNELFQSAWHGSPHIFEKFSLVAIGTGEGAQAYGWGLYFAGARAVAEWYRRALGGKSKITVDGEELYARDLDRQNVNNGLRQFSVPEQDLILEVHKRGSVDLAIAFFEMVAKKKREELDAAKERGDDYVASLAIVALDNADRAIEAARELGDRLKVEQPGRLYKVEIPEDEDYLLWDRPLHEQSDKVQHALRELGIDFTPFEYPTLKEALRYFNRPRVLEDAARDIGTRESLREGYRYALDGNEAAFRAWYAKSGSTLVQGTKYDGNFGPRNGEAAYEQLHRDQYNQKGRGSHRQEPWSKGAQWASEALAALGVAGIKYLDGNSRTAGEGNFNYVIFDEKLVEITEFSQKVEQLTPDGIREWTRSIREEFGEDLVAFDVYLAKNGDLSLETLAVKRGANNAGLGTKVMQRLTAFADQHARRIVLSPAGRGHKTTSMFGPPSATTTGRERLVRFYKRFGFVENKGRHKDHETLAAMIRQPTVSPTSLAQSLPEQRLRSLAPADVKGVTDARVLPFPSIPESSTLKLLNAGGSYRVPGSSATRPSQRRTIRLADLIGTQATFTLDVALEKVATRDEAIPEVIELAGRFYLMGGHHRAVAAWARGEETIEVDAFSVDPAKLRGTEFFPEITESPEFQAFFGASKVVDEDGAPRVVYTGTTGTFTVFDLSRANVESDMGAGIYFSSNPADVGENYAGEGPDLTQKIEMRVEQMFDAMEEDERRELVEEATGKTWEELSYEEKRAPLRARVKAQLSVEHGGLTMPVYLKIENPAIIGGENETVLELTREYDESLSSFDPADVEELRAEGVEEEDLIRELMERNGYEPTESGTLLAFVEALRNVSGNFDADNIDVAIDELMEAASYESIGLADAIDLLKKSEGLVYATDDVGNHAASEIIRQALERAGFDGIIDHTVNVKFGSERQTGKSMAGMDEETVHYIVFDPRQIKSAIGNRGTFDPREENILYAPARRGSIRFGADRQMTISLFEDRNLSTFLHESGHFFLEVMQDLAKEGSPEIVRDLAILREWFASETIGEREHEMFAEAFELYLREGKAPSLELREVFATFRAWLLGIYRVLTGFRVELSDEVRGVMDRMLATDQAIADAAAASRVDPMFLTAEAAGMSERDFALYRATVQDASNTARERLEQRLMAEAHRAQTAEWKARREEIEDEVTADVQSRPIYQALAAMRTGTTPDGKPLSETEEVEPLKLSREMLVDRFGLERLKRLPRPYIYSSKGGVDPDSVAALFGFSSTDELLTAAENARPMKEVIQQETDARMLEEHGSLLLDGKALEAAAIAALGNEDREIVVRAELRALGALRRKVDPFVKLERQKAREAVAAEKEKTAEVESTLSRVRRRARGGAAYIRAALPRPEDVLHVAKYRIARTRIQDLNPAIFWAASRRAAAKAIDLAARQDLDGAIVAKQQELLNLAMFREAQRTLEDVAARVKQAKALGKPAARSRLGLAGQNYLDQIDGILDRYEFALVSQKVLKRRASLRKFVEGLEAQGIPVDLDDALLEEAAKVNYRELTVEQLIGVSDGLRQILHLANLKNRLINAKEQRELQQLVDDLTASIDANKRGTRREPARDRRPSEERRRTIGDFFAGHVKLSSMLRELDGFKDGGPMWSAIMRPLNEAANREAEMQADATRKFAEIIERAFPGKAKRDLYEKLHIPAIGASLSRMERIMVAANWGNEGNRDRVRRAEGWSDQQVQEILDTLTGSELRFVQDVFDLINGYWPEIAAKQERVYGIAPEKVDAVEIVAAGGTIRGGYFPLKYDDRQSASAIAALDLEAANLAKQAAYAQSTTKRGHTKERQARVKIPVRLDFGVMFEHVAQVIHDLSHHETLIDVSRVLGHKQVQDAILEAQGDMVYKQIRNTIRDIAFGDVPAVTGFERAVNHIRMGATVAGLGWNLTTAALQPLGLANSIVRIGPRWVARGVIRWMRNPTTMVQTVKWIADVSPFMRARGRTMNREISEARSQFGVETGTLKGWIDDALKTSTFSTVDRQAIADSFFWMIQQMQRVVDVPTWLGAYEKAMAAGHPEDRAIAMADQAVLDSQGGGQIKDLSQVQRGGPMFKLWTNFYSYFSVVYQQAREAKRSRNLKHPAEVGRMAADYLMLFIVPASLGFFLKRLLRNDEEDEDENVLVDLAFENLSYAAGTMLGLREGSAALAGYAGYEGPAGARAFAAVGRFGAQARQLEIDEAFLKALNDVGGVLLHYPSGQVRRTVEGIAAIAEGKTYNPLAPLVGPPREK